MKILLAIIIIGFWVGQGYAQNFKEDCQLMQDAYKNIDKLSAHIEVNVYASYNATKQSIVKNATVEKNGTSYLTVLDGVTMLLNNKYIVLVDPINKAIVYSKRDLKKENTPIPYLGSLDSALKKYDSVKFIGDEVGLRHYTIYSSKQSIQRSEVYIDESKHLITKLIYYYDQSKFKSFNKVIIVFKDLTLTPQFNNSEFSESKFLIFKGNTILPVSSLSGYKVHVNDEDSP